MLIGQRTVAIAKRDAEVLPGFKKYQENLPWVSQIKGDVVNVRNFVTDNEAVTAPVISGVESFNRQLTGIESFGHNDFSQRISSPIP